ncbi:MAG: VOC family protein [Candidatus Latescibacteria bacterium]|nr:VOC family protein [Candidatus Latescibacterota bacterium]
MTTTPQTKTAANVQQAVPFFAVDNMAQSLEFYLDGLGFAIDNKWEKDGQIRWCWLKLGGASLMLQEFRKEGHDSWVPQGKVGEGVSICFMCQDALAIYREGIARGLSFAEPQVGNGLWVASVADPDGYKLLFESPTDAPEEAMLSDVE